MILLVAIRELSDNVKYRCLRRQIFGEFFIEERYYMVQGIVHRSQMG